ncbi:MAG: universal stress protein [Euryarchaeota archaeon]|nr:universal stress protein [Euryarchaeota archaeon]
MVLRLLFPLDGSERSFAAMERALILFKATPGLQVTLFNVMQKGFETAPETTVEEFDEDEGDEIFPTEDSSLRMLAKAQAVCKKHGVAANEKAVKGKVADEIIRETASHDVIVMHSLDRKGFGEVLRGSKTEHIARSAKCLVLLSRED